MGYVRCSGCNRSNDRPDPVTNIILPIRQFGDPAPITSVHEGLLKYIKPEILNQEDGQDNR